MSTDRGYRAVLADRRLRPYLLGTVGSAIGSELAQLGFLLVVFQATRSVVLAAGVTIAEAAPYVLFGLIGGALADRLPRLPVMLGLDVARTVLQLVTFVLVLNGDDPYILLLAVVFSLQLGRVFFFPAQLALLAELAPTQQLTAANALAALGTTAAPLLAPAAAAILLATIGPGGFFLVDAATYAFSASCLTVLARRAPKSARRAPLGAPIARGVVAQTRATAEQIRQFGRVAWGHRPLRALLLATFACVLLSTWARQIGLLTLAHHISSHPAQLYAIALGVLAAAGLIAGLLLPLISSRLTLSHYAIGAGVWGAGIAASALSTGTDGLLVAAAGQGVGFAIASATRTYQLQTTVPEDMSAQGFAAAAMLLYLADIASLAAFGALSTIVTPALLVGAGGVGTLIVAAIIALGQRAPLRRANSPTPASEPPPQASSTTSGRHGGLCAWIGPRPRPAAHDRRPARPSRRGVTANLPPTPPWRADISEWTA